MSIRPLVLVLGATGLFGELLVRRMVDETTFSVVGAGRGLAALKKLQTATGIDIVAVDRDDSAAVATILNDLQPFAVVDCAGPFQHYGDSPYQFAEQVLLAGCHYLDIADAGLFVAGITALDQLAKQNGLVAISGLSSTPAISAAAVDMLSDGMTSIESIETVIIPGNRARRTMSVMRAILGQIGQPFQIHRFGVTETVLGWSETQAINLRIPVRGPLQGRLAALIHTPDVDLFPTRYSADTVTVAAGLELKTFHRALQLAQSLVRYRVIKTFLPFASLARWIASWFEHIGSDTGGMQVTVAGRVDQSLVKRTWELVADDGRGPEIPTLPVSVLLEKLHTMPIAAGARASPGEITLEELDSRFNVLDVETISYEESVQPLFRQVLGDELDALPNSVVALHNTLGRETYSGTAQSLGPNGLSGRLVAWLVGFPKAADKVAVVVTITADGEGETWVRDFNGKKFVSHLSVDRDGYAQERFGVITARLGLQVREGRLHYPVVGSRVFGFLPVPQFLLPTSIAHESVDEQGRFVFDVLIKTPFGARIAHYQGWLVRQATQVREQP